MATYYNASPPPKQPIERQIQEMQQKGVYPRQLDMIGILRPNAVIKKNPASGAPKFINTAINPNKQSKKEMFNVYGIPQ